ncbi:unnamed protein product [Acanthosepion pharaonis]|uniref:Aminotransferase class I/classII large domain-containing protein n=1 Tax=Acanthosepion pharaonis TaxID=158019 RepID=A0A812CYI4_ACAPH|nr:unnamed protein product [Sepia pharaonis]
MNSTNTISQRALDVIHYPDPLLSYVTEAKKNPYQPMYNENGVVEIGLAENKLCEDLIKQKLTELLPTKIESDDLYYFTNHGSVGFRRAIKNFLNKFFNPLNPINEENLVVVTGVTCVLDLVADGLAEEGDRFLCPAPYYSRIRNDIHDKSQVYTYDVDIAETGVRIKGIIVINPNNPSGQLLTKEEIDDVLQFTKLNNIHAIFDEIYGLSIHSRKNVFRSVSSVENLDPEKTHFMWGLSKDIGLAGFRCGVLHTTNKELLNFVQKVAFCSSLPLFVQKILESLLNQTEWLETKYFPILQQRLEESYQIATERLKKLGVTIYPSDGGFFIWANFSKFMQDKSFKSEDDLISILLKGTWLVSNHFYAKFGNPTSWFGPH